jgi:hypothetical protein
MKVVKNTLEGLHDVFCPCCGMVSPTNNGIKKERLRQSLLRKEEEQGL